jgi:nitric oxide dioxygenase
VVAAVGHLDDLSKLNSALAVAVHKHCALGVQPEHYQIVHDNFLAATAQILGDAVSAEVADAWSAVLLTVANHFVNLEDALYAETTRSMQDWNAREAKEFVVASKEIVADNLVSIELERSDKKLAPPFIPGQFVTLCANPTTEKYFAPRHYTVASPSANKNRLRICVKKVGLAETKGIMSSYVHDTLTVGDKVMLRAPFGEFTLNKADSFDNVLFISAGAGVTPALAMLPSLAKAGKNIAHFHVEATTDFAPLKRELDAMELAYSKVHCDSNRKDVTAAMVAKEVAGKVNVLDKKTLTMLCAPPKMIHELNQSLLQMGVDQTHIQWENFGPRHQ